MTCVTCRYKGVPQPFSTPSARGRGLCPAVRYAVPSQHFSSPRVAWPFSLAAGNSWDRNPFLRIVRLAGARRASAGPVMNEHTWTVYRDTRTHGDAG